MLRVTSKVSLLRIELVEAKLCLPTTLGAGGTGSASVSRFTMPGVNFTPCFDNPLSKQALAEPVAPCSLSKWHFCKVVRCDLVLLGTNVSNRTGIGSSSCLISSSYNPTTVTIKNWNRTSIQPIG